MSIFLKMFEVNVKTNIPDVLIDLKKEYNFVENEEPEISQEEKDFLKMRDNHKGS